MTACIFSANRESKSYRSMLYGDALSYSPSETLTRYCFPVIFLFFDGEIQPEWPHFFFQCRKVRHKVKCSICSITAFMLSASFSIMQQAVLYLSIDKTAREMQLSLRLNSETPSLPRGDRQIWVQTVPLCLWSVAWYKADRKVPSRVLRCDKNSPPPARVWCPKGIRRMEHLDKGTYQKAFDISYSFSFQT